MIEEEGLTFVAWTSPYAPFFGAGRAARAARPSPGSTATALDRVRLFEQEHETRLALERANELMTNFVALAAHELRTPVTTIHGFVQTLNHSARGSSEEQKVELREALEQQTHRMAALVEQLLDLSRLDADAVDVRPQVVELEPRLREVVAIAAPAHRRRGRGRPSPRTRAPSSIRRFSTTSSRTSSRTRCATAVRPCA